MAPGFSRDHVPTDLPSQRRALIHFASSSHIILRLHGDHTTHMPLQGRKRKMLSTQQRFAICSALQYVTEEEQTLMQKMWDPYPRPPPRKSRKVLHRSPMASADSLSRPAGSR
uniref:Uncharacterized protein n=1 Tax=Branchiostoma floridae TaxID=7739 RepID=C3XQ76_BRAFL|eukprot:XP_002614088.1 hypothetical protein BRAFLDRAFT_67326 [Branchiostoma floridae]